MISGLNHITLAVTDIDRSFNFYKETLCFKPLVKWDMGAYFLLKDDVWFCLNVDRARIANPCYTHYAFTVDHGEFDSMSKRILASGTSVFKDNTSPGESLYFLDPDGHKLEIHAGNWQTRVTTKQKDHGNWNNVQWYV